MKLSVWRGTHCQVDHFSWASLHFSLGIQPKVHWQEMREQRVIPPSLSASMPGTSHVCVALHEGGSDALSSSRAGSFPLKSRLEWHSPPLIAQPLYKEEQGLSLVFGYFQRWLSSFTNYLQFRAELVSSQFLPASLQGAGKPVPRSSQYFP